MISLKKHYPPSIFFQIVDESCTDRLSVQLELLNHPPYPADRVLLHVQVWPPLPLFFPNRVSYGFCFRSGIWKTLGSRRVLAAFPLDFSAYDCSDKTAYRVEHRFVETSKEDDLYCQIRYSPLGLGSTSLLDHDFVDDFYPQKRYPLYFSPASLISPLVWRVFIVRIDSRQFFLTVFWGLGCRTVFKSFRGVAETDEGWWS